MLRRKGFTLVEIMIVVAIIGLLAAIAIPNFVRARTQAQTQACIANLKQIEGAKQVWALDTGAGPAGAPDWAALVPTYIRRQPACPANGVYAINTVDVAPTCTIAGHVLP
jgi:type II secretion system protein G